jgi:hypothetical protein
VLWRDDGIQRSLSFANLPSAERFTRWIDDHGPAGALRIIERSGGLDIDGLGI